MKQLLLRVWSWRRDLRQASLVGLQVAVMSPWLFNHLDFAHMLTQIFS